MSAGVVGLLEAIDHYDASREIKLMTFAKLRIEGAILDSLRQLDWSPRSLRKKSREVEDALRRLRLRMERAPSVAELAQEMGMSRDSMDALLCELRGLDLGSLEALESQGENGDPLWHYTPVSPDEDPLCLCLQSELRECLTRAVSELPERERQVIALYYVEELTMKEVGVVLGVREARISQIHSAALLRLRSRMQDLLASRRVPPPPSPASPEQYDGYRP
jgi:RNA polymerase sigma factor for flagellar operon FliA